MDFNAPLGMRPPKRPQRRLAVLVGLGAVVLVCAGIGALLLTADPHGGEPTATAAIPPFVPKTAAAPSQIGADPMPTASVAPDNRLPRTDAPTIENGVRVYRGSAEIAAIAPSSTSSPMVIDVSKALDDADRKSSRSGSATLSDDPKTAAAQPRVAIFVGGMGLDATTTRTAIETLPRNVTLAFVPDAAYTAASLAAAKAKGHEILLQLPMQNAGTDGSSHTLKADAPAAKVGADLSWLMSRLDGYDGVINFLGAPVTSNEAVMTTILRAVGARNLFYVDDGTSKASVATAIAPSVGTPAARADVVLDATSDPAVVRANLDTLVAIARRNGSAIGMASGLPNHLGTIARFAASLADQGVALVPVNAIVNRRGSLATAQ